jgi:hypothetical protein
LSIVSLLEETVDTTDGEGETGLGGTRGRFGGGTLGWAGFATGWWRDKWVSALEAGVVGKCRRLTLYQTLLMEWSWGLWVGWVGGGGGEER